MFVKAIFWPKGVQLSPYPHRWSTGQTAPPRPPPPPTVPASPAARLAGAAGCGRQPRRRRRASGDTALRLASEGPRAAWKVTPWAVSFGPPPGADPGDINGHHMWGSNFENLRFWQNGNTHTHTTSGCVWKIVIWMSSAPWWIVQKLHRLQSHHSTSKDWGTMEPQIHQTGLRQTKKSAYVPQPSQLFSNSTRQVTLHPKNHPGTPPPSPPWESPPCPGPWSPCRCQSPRSAWPLRPGSRSVATALSGGCWASAANAADAAFPAPPSEAAARVEMNGTRLRCGWKSTNFWSRFIGEKLWFKRWKLIGAVSHGFPNPKKQVAFQTMQGIAGGFTILPWSAMPPGCSNHVARWLRLCPHRRQESPGFAHQGPVVTLE